MTRRSAICALGAGAVSAFAKIGRIELGVCGSTDNFEKAQQYGFDYYEPGAAAVAAMSDAAFASFRDRVFASTVMVAGKVFVEDLAAELTFDCCGDERRELPLADSLADRLGCPFGQRQADSGGRPLADAVRGVIHAARLSKE